MQLSFFYDVVCPYAYLASQRVEAMAARTGAELIWCPVLLGGLYQHHESAQVPAQTWAANKVAIGARDLMQQAAHHGAPFNHSPLHPQRSVSAMRLIVAAPQSVRPALSHDLFAAYHVQEADINDPGVLSAIAERHGLDVSVMSMPAIKQELRDRTAAAAQAGAFGVPTFEVDGQLWWGQDRMDMVEHALGGPRAAPQSAAEANDKHLTFFHDFSSPFSYLASTQIDRIATMAGATVNWRPILLGALFKEVGTANVPLFTMSEAKQRYVGLDLDRWAQWWGVPFTFPKTFPIRTVTALRVAIQAPEATAPLYRAVWAGGQDIGDLNVLSSVLTEAGLDAAALIEVTQNPALFSPLAVRSVRRSRRISSSKKKKRQRQRQQAGLARGGTGGRRLSQVFETSDVVISNDGNGISLA